MIKNYKEEHVEAKVILDEITIAPIHDMLLTHSNLFIEFPSLEYSFPTKTILQIITMSSHTPEEIIRFTYRIHEFKRRKERNASIQDLQQAKLKLNAAIDQEFLFTPMINPINDNSIQEKHKNLFSEATSEEQIQFNYAMQMRLTTNENKEIDERSLEVKYTGAIGKYIKVTLLLWAFLYMILITLGIVFAFHSWYLYNWNQRKFTISIGCDILTALLTVIIGNIGMIVMITYYSKQKIDKEYLNIITLKSINLWIIIDIVASFCLFLYFDYFIDDLLMKAYIATETYFQWIIISMIITQLACLLLNLKMESFINECHRMAKYSTPLLE